MDQLDNLKDQKLKIQVDYQQIVDQDVKSGLQLNLGPSIPYIQNERASPFMKKSREEERKQEEENEFNPPVFDPNESLEFLGRLREKQTFRASDPLFIMDQNTNSQSPFRQNKELKKNLYLQSEYQIDENKEDEFPLENLSQRKSIRKRQQVQRIDERFPTIQSEQSPKVNQQQNFLRLLSLQEGGLGLEETKKIQNELVKAYEEPDEEDSFIQKDEFSENPDLWRDPFARHSKYVKENQKNQHRKQYIWFWYIFEYDYYIAMVKSRKNVFIEMFKLFILNLFISFFGVILLLLLICFPQNFQNREKPGKYDQLVNFLGKNKRVNLSIKQLLTTLWYNADHLIFQSFDSIQMNNIENENLQIQVIQDEDDKMDQLQDFDPEKENFKKQMRKPIFKKQFSIHQKNNFIEVTSVAREQDSGVISSSQICGCVLPPFFIIITCMIFINFMYWSLLFISLDILSLSPTIKLLVIICLVYLIINVIFFSIWILGSIAGNWHRQQEERLANQRIIRRHNIDQTFLYFQLMTQISEHSIWNQVGSLQNTDQLNQSIINRSIKWYNGFSCFHYYLFVYHDFSLSYYRQCISPSLKSLYVQYERALTSQYPNKFTDVFSGDQQAQKFAKGIWICGININQGTIFKLVLIIARFALIFVAINQSIAFDENNNTVSKEQGGLFKYQTEFVLIFILTYEYLILFFSSRFHSIRQQRLNGLIRLSGLIDYVACQYDFKNSVPVELPPFNVFCFHSMETWYSLRKILFQKNRVETYMFDLDLSLIFGVIFILIMYLWLSGFGLLKQQSFINFIAQHHLLIYFLLIDLFLVFIVMGLKVKLSADINEHSKIHKKMLSHLIHHYLFLKEFNMESIIIVQSRINQQSIIELQRLVQFYLINGTLHIQKDDQLRQDIAIGKYFSINDFDEEQHMPAFLKAYKQYIGILVQKAQSIQARIDLDDQFYSEKLLNYFRVDYNILTGIALFFISIFFPLLFL